MAREICGSGLCLGTWLHSYRIPPNKGPACLYLLICKACLWFEASSAKLGILKTKNLFFTAVMTTGERKIAKPYFMNGTVIFPSVSSLVPCSLIYACTAINKKKTQFFRNPKLSQLPKIITQPSE